MISKDLEGTPPSSSPTPTPPTHRKINFMSRKNTTSENEKSITAEEVIPHTSSGKKKHINLQSVFSTIPPAIENYIREPTFIPIKKQPTGTKEYLPGSILMESFDLVKTRNRFVRRVYIILALQLLFTFGFLLLVSYVPPARKHFTRNKLLLFVTFLILYVLTSLFLTCCVSYRRRVPLNFILLCLMTISLTIVLCVVSIFFKTNIVMYAMGTTIGVVILVSLFACQTKFDATSYFMYVYVATGVLILCGLCVMVCYVFGMSANILNFAYSGVGALLFSLWLMIDTQLVLGGRKLELQPEEYLFGALTLYLDIVIIFTLTVYLFSYCCKYSSES